MGAVIPHSGLRTHKIYAQMKVLNPDESPSHAVGLELNFDPVTFYLYQDMILSPSHTVGLELTSV